MIQTVQNQAQFDLEIGQTKRPVICLFWIGFCQSCKQMYSVFQSLESRFSDTAKFIAVNLEELPKLGDQAGVLVVPTLVFYRNGRTINRLFGYIDETLVVQAIEEAIVD